jgi:ATP-dependent Lhr-like helicase
MFSPDHPVPAGIAVGAELERESAAAEALRGHLEVLGPVTASELALASGLPRALVDAGAARLEAEGFALRGSFDPGVGEEQWCARRLLTRIHSYSQQRRRREIEPVSSQNFMRFLLRWQFAAPGTQREGRAGVLQVVEQLQGFELAAGAWEESVLRARVERYRSEWLDDLCMSGQIAWGRLTLKRAEADPDARPRRSGATPSRATPISFAIREDLSWLLPAVRGGQEAADPRPGRTLDVLEALRGRGALFRSEIAEATGRLPAEVDEALWEGVAQGLITADGFQAVRSLLSPADRWSKRQAHRRGGLRRGAAGRGRTSTSEGRWSRFPARHDAEEIVERIDPDELAEAIAEQLLARWGVVFYDLLVRETLAVPWREILWALRRMEARGTIRGGRFVAGFHGEQFALPSAVDGLKHIRSRPTSGETVRLSAVDPLNLVGIVVPGERVSAVRSNTVTYVDGVPAELAEARA